MTPAEIRTVTHLDDPDLLRGLAESLDGLWEADARRNDPLVRSDWPQHEGEDYLRAVAADDDAVLLAAQLDGAVCGHLVGRFHAADGFRTGPVAALESMQVTEGRRGGGAGSALVQVFLEWARGRGAVRVGVTASAPNEGALRFYRRHGFEPAAVTLRLPIG